MEKHGFSRVPKASQELSVPISSTPQSSLQAYSRLRNPLRLGTMAGKRNCASDTFGSILGMGRAEGKAYGASGDAIIDLILRCNYFGQHVNLMDILQNETIWQPNSMHAAFQTKIG